jgi:uncharacterized protein (DUF362 family)
MKTAAAVAAGLTMPFGSSCSSDEESMSSPIEQDTGVGTDTQNETNQTDGGGITSADRTKVGMVKDVDVLKMTRDAIERAGGLSEISGGDRVVIKPNITAGSPLGGVRIFTSPEVLRGVIQAVLAHTDKSKVTVAEACAFGRDTVSAARQAGILDVCEQEGVDFLAWNDGEYSGFRSPDWKHIVDEKRVPQTLNPMSFNHFINVPILKNHEMPSTSNQEFTCCMKNFVGLLPYGGEGSRSNDSIHTADLGEKVAELGMIVPRITMNVVDALTVILTGGPAGINMDTADAGLVLASKDRVACDSVAVAVLKHHATVQGISKSYVTKSVWDQAQIIRGRELGLGTADPTNIEISDQGVEELEGIKTAWV